MYNVAFDTTAAACSIGLMQDDKILDSYVQAMDFGQAEVLIPQIKNLMEKNHISFDELDMITVCTGPGSFTGVRSSISAARAFGLAKPNIQICGANDFDSYVVSIAFSPE